MKTVNPEDLLGGLPEFFTPEQELFGQTDGIVEANWKLFLESFIEGYHIKPAHSKTFFPFGYDNLNVNFPAHPPHDCWNFGAHGDKPYKILDL